MNDQLTVGQCSIERLMLLKNFNGCMSRSGKVPGFIESFHIITWRDYPVPGKFDGILVHDSLAAGGA